MKRLAATIPACIVLLFLNTGVVACQVPAVGPRILPSDPDAAVVLDAIVEAREYAIEDGKITGDLWHLRIVRVLKGDNSIHRATQFKNNGSCWSWRPPIGGRSFLFGTLTQAQDGRSYVSGEWFSPAEAATFSWIRFGEYRGPSPHVAPTPEIRDPANSAAKSGRLSDDELRAEREARTRAY